MLQQKYFVNGSAILLALLINIGAVRQALGHTWRPSVPTDVSATAITSELVTLTWSASAGNGGPGFAEQVYRNGPLIVAGYQVYRDGTLIGTSTATSYLDPGLSPGTQYCYTIVAYDNAGYSSAASSPACVTTPAADTAPPSVPTGVSATANSATQITLTWSASTDTGGSGLAGYLVYRAGALVSTTTATNYLDSGLSADTQYCYTIAAYDNDGNNSATSAQACAVTLIGSSTTGPPVPGGVSATAISSSQITVTWNSSTDSDGSDVAGYEVYRDGTFLGNTTATNYTDGGLSPNTQYCYTIAAYDSAGNTSSSSPQTCASTVVVTLTWVNDSSDVEGIQIERSTPDTNNFVQIAVVDPSATNYTDTTITCGVTYYYVVQAYNAAGESPDSNIAGPTTETCSADTPSSTNDLTSDTDGTVAP